MQGLRLAYLAGLMDGEGTIRIDRHEHKGMRNYAYNAHLSLGSVDKIMAQMFYDEFGGSTRVESIPGKRPIYRWYIRGNKKALEALTALLPYLVVKKHRAEIVIKFIVAWEKPYNMKHGVNPQELQRREEAYQMMRKLNAVGPAATTKRENIREDEAIV